MIRHGRGCDKESNLDVAVGAMGQVASESNASEANMAAGLEKKKRRKKSKVKVSVLRQGKKKREEKKKTS